MDLTGVGRRPLLSSGGAAMRRLDERLSGGGEDTYTLGITSKFVLLAAGWKRRLIRVLFARPKSLLPRLRLP